MLVFNLALVLIVAETIPLDRQFKLRELLDALPLSRTPYLRASVRRLERRDPDLHYGLRGRASVTQRMIARRIRPARDRAAVAGAGAAVSRTNGTVSVLASPFGAAAA